MSYDNGNVFAKILRGELPCSKVYEDDHVLAFNDIAPQSTVHVLMIPKGAYVSMDDFSSRADDAAFTAFFRTVGKIARDLGVDSTGYRMIANHGPDSHQLVPHFHVHILGGESLGTGLVNKAS